MSRCRATSFFVSPNDRRYFRDLTIATKDGDDWVVFTHRNDIGKYQATHPDWGGVCFIGPKGGATALQETLDTHPEQVERWVLDERVANGRAPGGPAAAIYQLASRGPVALSARQLSERLFPGANKPLRHASEAAVTAPSGAFALSVAVVLRERLGDDVAATTLKKMEEWPTLHVSAADPRELSSLFNILAGRYGTQRARTLFESLADVNQLPTEWRIVLAEKTSDAWLLATLGADESRNVRYAVARNPAAPPETLAALSADEDANVRQGVANNAAAPAAIRAAILVASRDSADHAAAAMLDVPWDAPRPDHPGLAHLREVSMVAVSGVEVKWPDKPGSIFDLPGRGALPWSIDSAALTLNNKVIHDGSKDYTLEVLESPHALKQNANDMGNCTYKSYAKHIAEGRCVIVALRGKGEKNEDKIFYNAEFVANDDGTWELGQVNSIRNEGNVPPLVTQQLRDYAKSITA